MTGLGIVYAHTLRMTFVGCLDDIPGGMAGRMSRWEFLW